MKVAYSCVVDGAPKFEWQAFLWAHSLLRNAAVSAKDIFVHCLPHVSEHFRGAVRELGVRVVDVAPFEGAHAYCNKIQQCFSGAFEGYDRAVLTDCDLFFIGTPVLSDDGPIVARVVDMPNPPLQILREIYQQAGLPVPKDAPVACALTNEDVTFASNLNGGFYSISVARLAEIGASWKKHALWLAARQDVLGTYGIHVDQVAMALALDELGIAPTYLGTGTNLPVHLAPERLRVLAPSHIDVLHYHSSVVPTGHIKPTGLAQIDIAIAKANADIDAIIQENFDNALFWNWRYACFPELGSGVGSRGDVLEYKRAILKIATAFFADKNVLDVGCGDIETTKELQLRNYFGMDVSEAALEIARQKRPDWRFASGTLSAGAGAPSAALTICLDVLIHQKDRKQYEELVAGLVRSAGERLIISGYDSAPSYSSAITAFHEPLSTTLAKSGAFTEILHVGTYRDVSLFVADKRPVGPARHPNDIPPPVLKEMLPLAPRKDLLLASMDTSRQWLGFFTQTSIRTVEYPWMYEKLLSLAPHSHVLDIGAGASPMPIMLANLGMRVDTVDLHQRVLDFNRRNEWNEWGFLDYSRIHPSIRSFHIDIMQYAPDELYDVIYSLSVIEHMPRPIWEGTLERAAAWLKPGGKLILTLDLVPGTLDLWNRSEGAIVDHDGNHGVIEDITGKVQSRGLVFDEAFVTKSIPFSRTDVAFLVAHRP